MKKFKKCIIFIIILNLFFIFFSCKGYSYWIWTPDTGEWINPKYAVKDSPRAQYQHARTFFKDMNYERAIKEFKKLVEAYPKSKHAPKAQYFIGRSYENIDKFYKAFKAYQKVIDKYPYTERLNEIIVREIKIGNKFYKGKKGEIWGLPLVNPEERAIEIFEKVIQNSPYGKNVDEAYYKLGMAYKKKGAYRKAKKAFNKLNENFPESKLAKEAEYQAAYSAYKYSLNPSYDQQATDKTIKEFEGFIKKHPHTELAKKAEKRLNILKQKRAKNLFHIAKFYQQRGHVESAVIYYKEIAQKYPDTKWATQAMEKLTIIKKGK